MTEIAPRIVVDETVRFGKPVIAGTRVPVDLVLAKLGAGMTLQEFQAEHGITAEPPLLTALPNGCIMCAIWQEPPARL